MMKDLQTLEDENKRLLDLLIKHSKGDKINSSAFQIQFNA